MKDRYKLALTLAVAGFVLVPALFWIGGYGFDTRGPTAVFCTILTLIVGLGLGILTAFND